MKRSVLLLSLLALSACTPNYESIDNNLKFPDELKDCKAFRLDTSNGNSIVVVRCPNSTTSSTYSAGKSTNTSVVIDGKEYKEK